VRRGSESDGKGASETRSTSPPARPFEPKNSSAGKNAKYLAPKPSTSAAEANAFRNGLAGDNTSHSQSSVRGFATRSSRRLTRRPKL